MVSVSQVGLSFGAFELFSDVTFMVNPKDRIGLTGKNGAGKSTLLKMIAGLQKPDTGVITIPEGFRIGYLPQYMVTCNNNTVLAETSLAFSEILLLEKEIDTLNIELSSRTDYESDDYHNLIVKLNELTERHNILGAGSLQSSIEKTLLGLGFSIADFHRPTSSLSGGWRMRIELAKILLNNSDLLLLDEPTNHLDIESIQWLEDYLVSFPGALILISHDRKFLDNVTNRTIELSLGKAYDYKVSYSRYVELRRERREQQMAAFRNQQKMIQDTEDFIERFRYKATKAVQVQSRIKQLEKLDRIEVEEEDLSTINIRFPTPVKSGKIALDIKKISKSYGSKLVLKEVDLILESGRRVAFVGKNGEGKSTLSKIIVNEIHDYEGTIKLGHNIKIGYFAQNQDELMDGDRSVFDIIDQVAVGDIRTKIRDILGAFLFRGDDVFKKVKVLSGGERSRLAIAKLLLEPYNLLVLDEPTNHLDMRSKDVLKQALLNYEGTLIIVSHDRDFLDGLVDTVYEFGGQRIKEHIGGIYEFLERKKLQTLQSLNTSVLQIPVQQNNKDVQQKGKLQYAEKKEFDKIVRKINGQISDSENKIQKLEMQIEIANKKLADPAFLESNGNDSNFFKEYDDLKLKLQQEMENWEQLHEELEKMMTND
ncbi:MAG TPA: ABC-F family ATP-binding cassette domain-containing protein [Bacteroidales bacterium]|nr:ABC-F family ATP-binding cassette domain-containing protein [Bacteroidales bacterium]